MRSRTLRTVVPAMMVACTTSFGIQREEDAPIQTRALSCTASSASEDRGFEVT